jgi:hypothetical protein
VLIIAPSGKRHSIRTLDYIIPAARQAMARSLRGARQMIKRKAGINPSSKPVNSLIGLFISISPQREAREMLTRAPH